MSMSKKDFNGIAKSLAAVRPLHPDHDSINHMNSAQLNYQRGAYTYWREACFAIANYCQGANPNFRRDQFIEACHD